MAAWPRATIDLAANHAADANEMASREVRRIQRDQSTIALKHGRISSISMPPVTMVFKVRDLALLETVRVGYRVKFCAEVARNGTMYVVVLEPVR